MNTNIETTENTEAQTHSSHRGQGPRRHNKLIPHTIRDIGARASAAYNSMGAKMFGEMPTGTDRCIKFARERLAFVNNIQPSTPAVVPVLLFDKSAHRVMSVSDNQAKTAQELKEHIAICLGYLGRIAQKDPCVLLKIDHKAEVNEDYDNLRQSNENLKLELQQTQEQVSAHHRTIESLNAMLAEQKVEMERLCKPQTVVANAPALTDVNRLDNVLELLAELVAKYDTDERDHALATETPDEGVEVLATMKVIYEELVNMRPAAEAATQATTGTSNTEPVAVETGTSAPPIAEVIDAFAAEVQAKHESATEEMCETEADLDALHRVRHIVGRQETQKEKE